VLEKARILDRHQRLDDARRDVLVLDVDPIFVKDICDEFAVSIVNLSRELWPKVDDI